MADFEIKSKGGTLTLSTEGNNICLMIEGTECLAGIGLPPAKAAVLARELLRAAGGADHTEYLIDACEMTLAVLDGGKPDPPDQAARLLRHAVARVKGAHADAPR